MKIQFKGNLNDIISIENLLTAWQEFLRGKRNKSDVQPFQLDLFDNIIELHEELASKIYRHGGYQRFSINDPKPRIIHKAIVRDRVLHRAIYRILYPFFDRTFIADSFSCRVAKGTHRALNRFRKLAYRVGKNHTKTAWVLKCDIRKFFDNIDHGVLLNTFGEYIEDKDILRLLKEIIESFSVAPGKGLPLGNLTSQLFCNIYMNKLDQFVKHKLEAEHYLRYSDDFVILAENREKLGNNLPRIAEFLNDKLKLSLHPDKIFIKSFASGMDFLGWVHFQDHRVLRTSTKNRMFRKIEGSDKPETLQSYLGLLSHGDAYKIKNHILRKFCR